MITKIKIASTGTGSTDGLASQLLCKLNAAMFASYFGYQYIDIPFDDYLIKGNSGHRYGEYSTALQNLVFSFPGFEKIDPLSSVYQRLKVIDIREILGKIDGHQAMREYLNSQITLLAGDYDIFVLNGFANIFSDKTYLYNRISKGTNLVIDPIFLNKNIVLSEKLKIAVHIRRGDILSHEVNKERIIPMEYFNNVMDKIKMVLTECNLEYSLSLHIEGNSDGFNHDHVKFQDENPISSFMDLFNSDLIVSSKSSHSSVPPMLSGKIMIYPNDSWFAPLPGWLPADKEGNFDAEKLAILLKDFSK